MDSLRDHPSDSWDVETKGFRAWDKTRFMHKRSVSDREFLYSKNFPPTAIEGMGRLPSVGGVCPRAFDIGMYRNV